MSQTISSSIAYKDFDQCVTDADFASEKALLKSAIKSANVWLKASDVAVINVETRLDSQHGFIYGIRVWYHERRYE